MSASVEVYVFQVRQRSTGYEYIPRTVGFRVVHLLKNPSRLLKYTLNGFDNAFDYPTIRCWSWLKHNLIFLLDKKDVRHFADDTFKPIFLNDNIRISFKIFVPKVPINNIPAFGSDKGLVPTRRQAIIWTNDGEIIDAYMRLSASMS